VADIFQVPVRTLCEEESGAFGAALQSIWNYHLDRGENVSISDITGEFVVLGDEIIDPIPENSGCYREMQERFNELWQKLSENFLFHREQLKLKGPESKK
jgi:sugar (pentulose or hexulose) kinase